MWFVAFHVVVLVDLSSVANFSLGTPVFILLEINTLGATTLSVLAHYSLSSLLISGSLYSQIHGIDKQN